MLLIRSEHKQLYQAIKNAFEHALAYRIHGLRRVLRHLLHREAQNKLEHSSYRLNTNAVFSVRILDHDMPIRFKISDCPVAPKQVEAVCARFPDRIS